MVERQGEFVKLTPFQMDTKLLIRYVKNGLNNIMKGKKTPIHIERALHHMISELIDRKELPIGDKKKADDILGKYNWGYNFEKKKARRKSKKR